jgi:hypothetical protein
MSGPARSKQHKTARKKNTPVRGLLKPNSTLQPLVKDGLAAVERKHLAYIDAPLRPFFADSLEVDENLRKGREKQNRWDYLLGHAGANKVFGLEPHSAKTDEVSTVIDKVKAAKVQLADHLKTGMTVANWFWVASGTVQFPDTGKTTLLLAQNGVRFVGTRLLAKHLA